MVQRDELKRRAPGLHGRFVIATAMLALSVNVNGVNAFTSHQQFWRPNALGPKPLHMATVELKQQRTEPIVVSQEAEELSHSATTMKLCPSYNLFQLLEEKEGGEIPQTTSGNALRDSTILKRDEKDSLDGLQITEFVGLGGKTKIETLPDPFKMVEKELQPFADSISELVSSDQPILSMAAKHFFEKRHGKRFRPTIVQLMAKAVAAANPEKIISDDGQKFTSDILQFTNSETLESTGGVSGWQWSGASTVEVEGGVITQDNHQGSDVWRRQAQLGQIVEMIHVASLIHDDVLDEAETRRGGEAVHKLYSNKVAVLAGDYLLARASVLLARLENTAVVQIMATALESLVAGEIMQLKSPPESLLEMETYLRKSYYKTASLICYACRSTTLLGGHAYGSTVATACEEFGFHLGLAYQIQDDILDFTAAASVLGKPALADMDLGLSTAPILYAAQENHSLRPLVMRRFKNKGDKNTALEALYKSPTAMTKASNLAKFHAQVSEMTSFPSLVFS
uniref:Trans-prenyltransferase 2 n=1 Tax=Haslea ostrearia TaxID=67476 RepID=A0A3G5BBW6_HASOS|nr:trans-prenyltransferase 2 [Haslea ostrearia]